MVIWLFLRSQSPAGNSLWKAIFHLKMNRATGCKSREKVSTELLTLAFDVFASPEKKDKTVVKSSTNLKNEIKNYAN
ncbi:hypothetical protein CEN46_21360 [Fischerella thermalis CCMEE 5318]|uniref:Uncharacterized protein n=1 Tax=Fischerella thermalis CCMEE 5318 TaxID=2019666 RepID=A0A2N6L8B9_9CYAN|nr:hypothetical protein CEN46_21360 [Fischerella thermalis CCMEE 5318]